jgi:hypothetical protein
MKWYVSGPTTMFLATALICLREAVTGPVTARPRRLVAVGILVTAAAALLIVDLTS